MLVGVWQVLVLVGAGAAYLAFVKKGEGAAIAALGTAGLFAVLAFGSLEVQGQTSTTQEWAVTILFGMTAALGALVFPVALTKSGPYATEDDADDRRRDRDEFDDPDSDFLDGIVGGLR